MVVHALARGCGLHVPDAQARRFSSRHHTFPIKRFDRTLAGRRIHFSNTDDHLRNHGFLLRSGRGWALAPAFDVNPVSQAHGLKLNVSEFDNALDLDLARSVAGYFRVSGKEADDIVANQRKIVAQWPTLAGRLGLAPREQSRLAHAFALAV